LGARSARGGRSTVMIVRGSGRRIHSAPSDWGSPKGAGGALPRKCLMIQEF
jgi:hypothetical protein